MIKYSILLFLFTSTLYSSAQKKSYTDSLHAFRKNYINSHEVVKDTNTKYLKFFPINEKFNIEASFTRMNDSITIIPTSSKKQKEFNTYGIAQFELGGKSCQLTIFQNTKLKQDEKYKKDLFIPFTDETTGSKSYGGGRYIDLLTDDIINGKLTIDFNKCYNPYCAYSSGWYCPIPPQQNKLPVAIKAGEKKYKGKHLERKQ